MVSCPICKGTTYNCIACHGEGQVEEGVEVFLPRLPWPRKRQCSLPIFLVKAALIVGMFAAIWPHAWDLLPSGIALASVTVFVQWLWFVGEFKRWSGMLIYRSGLMYWSRRMERVVESIVVIVLTMGLILSYSCTTRLLYLMLHSEAF